MKTLLEKVKATSDMTEKDLMEWMQAVQILLAWYNEGVGSVNPCPLCVVAWERGGDQAMCGTCLWWMFEGMTCVTYYSKLFSVELVNIGAFILRAKDTRYEPFVEARLPMLKEWYKVLHTAMKRRVKNVGSATLEKV